MPTQWIHQPHAAPQEVLRAVAVELGKNYPEPIVIFIAGEVALEAFARIKRPQRLGGDTRLRLESG